MESKLLKDYCLGDLRVVTLHVKNESIGEYDVGYIFYPASYEDRVLEDADICVPAGANPFGIVDSRPCVGCDTLHSTPLPIEVWLESNLDLLNKVMGTNHSL